jgi:t-SNARE complex subunit (syntaxin)
MNIYQELAAAQEKLGHVESSSRANLEQAKKELEDARKVMRQDDLAAIEERYNRQVEAAKQSLDKWQAEVTELQEQVDPEKFQAWRSNVEELETLKDRAWEAWRDSGGSEQEFSQAWPSVRRAVLVKRTLESLGMPDLIALRP